MTSLKLSALDLVPVRTDQTTGDALAASIGVAQAADRAGFTRYWVAEHHNMASVAATSPPVVISLLAARTERIRVGSGGVMLPNHAPLAVAEQFALLEAAYPGRIDLGIGRAPGSDPVTSMALRGPAGRGDEDIQNFPQYLDDVAVLMSKEGAMVRLRSSDYGLKATPHAVSTPPLWLLGSSAYSAHLAAEKGMPYVFAHHFSGQGTEQALQMYRAEFQPSELTPAPRTFLTVNAVVADTAAEAEALALPQAQNMARLRTGQPMGFVDLVEDAQATTMSPGQNDLIASNVRRTIVGTPAEAATEIRALAARYDVDEVMINPIASAYRGASPDRAVARERTLELLAKELL
ncbi:luciferase family oxidoreductase group 1 [Antricoccus suffuscus]|uniref:Luciferase family oxidoreductase group 1 n=1 Tax=Antricoccus suffuscus TaxID=1629062 RepID=A0A2T1A264_9ACTN|nr:LLM class flavin-dependent oxidoreductase [Antricoccus suffuscus]PRZ42695.1 luciferase family oxidoreductase group 1 [Antricoccus suffuscus]